MISLTGVKANNFKISFSKQWDYSSKASITALHLFFYSLTSKLLLKKWLHFS